MSALPKNIHLADKTIVVDFVFDRFAMNKTFRELAAYYARSQYETLTHQQKVARLYRKSLRSLTDWKPKRYQWNAVACEIRAEFDANRAADPACVGSSTRYVDQLPHFTLAVRSDAKRLLREGEARLQKFTHPDPYLCASIQGVFQASSAGHHGVISQRVCLQCHTCLAAASLCATRHLH